MWQDRDVDTSRDELIQDYLENELTPAEERTLRQMLGDGAFCRRVAQLAIEMGHLHDLERLGMLSRASVERLARSRRRVVAAIAVAASILLALGTSWLLAPTGDRTAGSALSPKVPPSAAAPTTTVRPAQQPIAQVLHVNGQVVCGPGLDSTDETAVAAQADLFPGQVLRTVDEDSFAVLQFADKSILSIASGTELRCSVDSDQKHVMVSAGEIMAQVTSQPAGKPMLIETPVAKAEVVGTKLSLFASSVLTKLAVLEGEVRLCRLLNGESVNVRSGESVTASSDSGMVFNTPTPVSSLWEVDFEEGVPRDWRAGELVRDSLPPGSRGAVRAVQVRRRGPFLVASTRNWTSGLFRIESDTHLNVTFKRTLRGSFCIRVNTGTNPLDVSSMEVFEYRILHWEMCPATSGGPSACLWSTSAASLDTPIRVPQTRRHGVAIWWSWSASDPSIKIPGLLSTGSGSPVGPASPQRFWANLAPDLPIWRDSPIWRQDVPFCSCGSF